MADDRRFLPHACLEPKVERDQDGLHLIIPYRNKTSLGLVFSPTARPDSQYNPFSFANLLLTEVGKIEGDREVQQACCCVCEKRCTTVAAAQFRVYDVYVCATQHSLMMHSGKCVPGRSERAT